MTRLTRKKSKKKTGGVGRLSVHTVQQMEEVPVAGIYSNMIFFFHEKFGEGGVIFFLHYICDRKNKFFTKKKRKNERRARKVQVDRRGG